MFPPTGGVGGGNRPARELVQTGIGTTRGGADRDNRPPPESSQKRAGEATNRKEPAKTPEETGDQDPPQEAGAGKDPEPAQKTKTERPRPAARASEAQEPDPPPQKHRDADGDGETTGGQAEETKPTNAEPTGREETRAADRRANAARPEPNRPEATDRTTAEGQAERTAASAPAAQPTETGTPQADTEPAIRRAREKAEPARRREPQKPTEGNGKLATGHPPETGNRNGDRPSGTGTADSTGHADTHPPHRRKARSSPERPERADGDKTRKRPERRPQKTAAKSRAGTSSGRQNRRTRKENRRSHDTPPTEKGNGKKTRPNRTTTRRH